MGSSSWWGLLCVDSLLLVGAIPVEVSWFSTTETQPFLHCFFSFFHCHGVYFSASRSGPRDCLGLPNWTRQNRLGPDFSPSPRLLKTQRPLRTDLKEPVRVSLNCQFVVLKKNPSKQAQERINWTKNDKDMDKIKYFLKKNYRKL